MNSRRGTDGSSIDGVLVIDKPAGMTSHTVVARVRRRLGVKKAGHAGTLDPLATGVLPVAVGRATRLIRFLQLTPKEYTGIIRLGWETDTCDSEGRALAPPRPVEVEATAVIEAMSRLTGALNQTPPAYSAKKVGGVAAHRLARKGALVELAPAPVTIYEFQLVRFTPPDVEFRAVCAAGAYMRSLARDLGRILGVGGHLGALRRLRVGRFDLDQAVALGEAGIADVTPAERLLTHMPRIELGAGDEERVRRGMGVGAETDADSVEVCIFNKKGELIAIGSAEKGWVRPRVVLL